MPVGGSPLDFHHQRCDPLKPSLAPAPSTETNTPPTPGPQRFRNNTSAEGPGLDSSTQGLKEKFLLEEEWVKEKN